LVARLPRRSAAAPNVLGYFDDALELGPLLGLVEDVALLRRREAALRREAEPIEVSEFRGRVDPALQFILALECAALRRHEAERDALALRQPLQRLEAAGAVVVVLHEVAVDVDLVEQHVLDDV